MDDKESFAVDLEQIRKRDRAIKVSNLFNSLENREAILLARLENNLPPSNLLDIYYLATPEEKAELLKSLKQKEPFNLSLLQKYSPSEKKYRNLPEVKKYQSMFSVPHEQLSELAKLLKKSEKVVRELKKSNLRRIQELVLEKGLAAFV